MVDSLRVEIPERVGPYRIEAPLGRHDHGNVYRAWDERLERRVAIQRLNSTGGDSEKHRRRLRREARAIAALDHPAVVRIYDLYEDDHDWIVMEHVEGRTLRDLLARRPFAETEVIALAREITDGLSAAHEQGLVHRNLVAETVLLTLQGHVKILDFGLARPHGLEGRDTLRTLQRLDEGAPPCTSPEQATGQRVDARSDLFALGVLLYEMLTGESVFAGDTPLATRLRLCQHRQKPVRELQPKVSPELSNLVERLLQKEPRKRPRNAAEVSSVLANLAGTAPLQPRLARLVESGSQELSDPDQPATGPRAESAVSEPAPGPEAPSAASPVAAWSLPGPSGGASVVIRTLVVAGLAERASLLRRLGTVGASEVFARYDRRVRDLLREFDGIELEKSDRFLLLFERPLDGVRFALAYQEGLEALAKELDLELKARLAIHVGEVHLRPNRPQDIARGAQHLEIQGRAKVVIEELEGLAEPGRVLVTQGVYELTRWAQIDAPPEESIAWRLCGEHRFRGHSEDLRLYEVFSGSVVLPGEGDEPRRLASGPFRGVRRGFAVLVRGLSKLRPFHRPL